jgi:hypothetical protein
VAGPTERRLRAGLNAHKGQCNPHRHEDQEDL